MPEKCHNNNSDNQLTSRRTDGGDKQFVQNLTRCLCIDTSVVLYFSGLYFENLAL